jgi:cycloeucalenol cycloisomerase
VTLEPTLTLQAYTVGSAFYGIYFLVSFPMFFYFDNDIDSITANKHVSIVNTVVSSFGCGMMVLSLLDFVRLYMNVPLTIQVQQM